MTASRHERMMWEESLWAHLLICCSEGKSLWRTFWLAGGPEDGTEDKRLSPFDWSRPVAMLTDADSTEETIVLCEQDLVKVKA